MVSSSCLPLTTTFRDLRSSRASVESAPAPAAPLDSSVRRQAGQTEESAVLASLQDRSQHLAASHDGSHKLLTAHELRQHRPSMSCRLQLGACLHWSQGSA